MLYFANNRWQIQEDRFKVFSLLSSGQALFETLFYDDGVLYFWERHFERLQKSLNFFKSRIELPDLRELIVQKLKSTTGFKLARVKLICLLPFEKTDQVVDINNIVLLIEPLSGHKKKFSSLKLKTVPTPFQSRAPLLQHKTINYGYHFYYRGVAWQQGFDDVLYFNARNEIMEVSFANIFAVKGDQLFTPPVEVGILPGVVRSLFVEELGAQEKLILTEQLADYDYFFVTSSVRELRFVTGIDHLTFEERFQEHFETVVQSWEDLKKEYRSIATTD